MRRSDLYRRRTGLAVIIATMLCAPAAGAVQYTITDLGTVPGASDSGARGINNAGQVIGQSGGTAFIWNVANGMQPLGTFTFGAQNTATDINAAGHVVGYGSDLNAEQYRPWLWTGSNGVQYLASVNTYVFGINDSGLATGGAGIMTGWVWDDENGLRLTSELPGGITTRFITDATNAGRLVGVGMDARALLWDSVNNLADIGALGGALSCSWDANEAGQVVGQSWTAALRTHAFYWDVAGGIRDLGVLRVDHTESYAHDINESGLVVGFSQNATSSLAFVWDQSNGLCDLNTLIDPTSGWTLTNAYAINDLGQIVGQGFNGAAYHAYLLSPVPEPGIIAVMGIGGIALLLRRRRT